MSKSSSFYLGVLFFWISGLLIPVVLKLPWARFSLGGWVFITVVATVIYGIYTNSMNNLEYVHEKYIYGWLSKTPSVVTILYIVGGYVVAPIVIFVLIVIPFYTLYQDGKFLLAVPKE